MNRNLEEVLLNVMQRDCTSPRVARSCVQCDQDYGLSIDSLNETYAKVSRADMFRMESFAY
uniref:hypothetical protein n=1 Tax=Roseivirga sp. TaxID=1964215 RepID=UPI00404786B2